MEGTAAAKLFYLQLQAAEIIGSTSVQSRPTARVEHVDRTFQNVPAFAAPGPTTGQESYAFPSLERPEEAIVAEIRTYSSLQDGWDGEGAAKPDPRSIESASNFIRLLSRDALVLEPTLHADGSIILEADNGVAIRFLDANQISAVSPNYTGIFSFDGTSIPSVIVEALKA